MLRVTLWAAVVCVWPVLLPAQADTAAVRKDMPLVFLDCPWDCDLPYIRTSVNYVNFVRDRAMADVYILNTTMATGGQGVQYRLFVEGQKRFEGMRDTLTFYTEADDTPDEIRQSMVKLLRRALLPFVARTSLAQYIEYRITLPDAESALAATNVRDPWNFWTFSVNLNGFATGEALFRSVNVTGGLTAARVTEGSKTTLNLNFNYIESSFFEQSGDGRPELFFRGINRSQFFNAAHVVSVSPRWSAGGLLNVRSDLFNNIALGGDVAAAVEYSVYPYVEAVRRQIVARYSVGAGYNAYVDSTLFDRTRELLARQAIDVGLKQVQKWGTLFLGINVSQFLHRPNMYSVAVSPSVEWNAFKGFNFSLGGNLAVIRDQITLPKGGLNSEEQLTQIRQLQTGYRYWGYAAVRYTFGSIYNNVVNPRFDNNSGMYFY